MVTVSRADEQPRDRDNPSQRWFKVVIQYEYEAGGAKRTGSHVGIGDAAQTGYAAAMRQTALYPVGKAVEVIVDPANPDNAALSAKPNLNLLFPIIFLGLGLVFLFVPL